SDVFGSEPTAPGAVPSPLAPSRPGKPAGFSFPEKEPESTGFAMSSGPELGFEDTAPAGPLPFAAPSPPPPTTAELPATEVPPPRAPALAPPAPAAPPPPAYPPPPAHVAADDPVTVPPSRPSKEDLAALDALLNPSGVARPTSPSASINPSASVRMRSTVP